MIFRATDEVTADVMVVDRSQHVRRLAESHSRFGEVEQGLSPFEQVAKQRHPVPDDLHAVQDGEGEVGRPAGQLGVE